MKRLLVPLMALAISTTAPAQSTSRVFFDLNYDAAENIAPVTVKTGCMMPLAAKPFPNREGYRFGGWYTTPDCLPEQEWRFGNNASFPLMPATDSMKVEKSMILYAKWVSPKPIRTAEELDAIRKDLDGWYVLEEDIDLSGIANGGGTPSRASWTGTGTPSAACGSPSSRPTRAAFSARSPTARS